MYLHIQYAGFCRQQKGRGVQPRHTRRKKGIPTANPSYVSKKISLPQLLYIVYQIFRLAQIFVGFFRWQQMTTIGIQCSIRQPVQYSSAGEFCIPPAVFRTVISLYRRAKPPARHCISFRLDRPAFSRQPYLLYRANLRLPFANNLSSQAPSAPATTFQEPQTNKQKSIQKNPQKNFKNNSKTFRD